MIERLHYLQLIEEAFEIHSVCAILGPRQCGKTTLAQNYAKKTSLSVYYFDLEHPKDLNALSSPSLVLESLKGLIIIDEIQRRPELFPYLRYLADYSDKKFLILGSASRDLIQQSSETLAGRISYLELSPLSLKEVQDFPKHWEKGGFPKSYLASSSKTSERWRFNYITTFLERDLANIGFSANPSLMRRLWNMIAHYHGQTVNYSELGRSLDLTDKTIKRYLDILEGAFMIKLLKPWHENLAKRQVKSPKVYIRDSGLLHTLLGITSDSFMNHPKVGASWEGYALEEIIRTLDLNRQQVYFWATEKGAELDLLVIEGGKRYGFEFKFSDSPRITRSMRIAQEDLNLSQLIIINPGQHSYQLEQNLSIIGLENYLLTDRK